METYDIVNDQWNPDSQLKTARKDHACSHLTLDDESGILVTGGVDDNNQPLNSVEFYSFRLREWIELGPMKIARTEHGLAIINGIPTVIGGISTTEFLANVEQLDASKDRDAPYAREWQIVPMVWNSIVLKVMKMNILQKYLLRLYRYHGTTSPFRTSRQRWSQRIFAKWRELNPKNNYL